MRMNTAVCRECSVECTRWMGVDVDVAAYSPVDRTELPKAKPSPGARVYTARGASRVDEGRQDTRGGFTTRVLLQQ